MIPKTIHFCWLSGDPYPGLYKYCLKTWHDVMPDYEFILWDKNRFPINRSVWVEEAYNAKKYAFAADYIRLYALYHLGGIYLDCDIEVLKRFDDLLCLPYFLGEESCTNRWEVGAFGAEKGTAWIKQCLDYYEGRHFVKEDGSYDTRPMPDVIHEALIPGLDQHDIGQISDFMWDKDSLCIFPRDWFCARFNPHPENNFDPDYIVSDNTYCVHHFGNSWLKANRARKLLKNISYGLGLNKDLKK